MNTPWGVVRGVLWNKTKEGTVETYVKEQALRSLRKLRSLRLILFDNGVSSSKDKFLWNWD